MIYMDKISVDIHHLFVVIGLAAVVVDVVDVVVGVVVVGVVVAVLVDVVVAVLDVYDDQIILDYQQDFHFDFDDKKKPCIVDTHNYEHVVVFVGFVVDLELDNLQTILEKYI